ncbi:MAG: peptidoglycan editing factor PgeF [Caldimonas sp.]
MNLTAERFGPEWAMPQVGAFMTTRSADASAAGIAGASGARPVFLHQVHGATVVRVGSDDALEAAPLHDADASVTTEEGVACVVKAADCLPVLFAAPGGRAVGAAHAGWRGLAAGVLEATVHEVCAAAACEPVDLLAWLGACIGPGAFEVGADVLAAFGVDASAPLTGFETRRFRAGRPGKWFADLPLLARDRLGAAGVVQISGGSGCTVAEASRFFSFRRDGTGAGRMVAAIWRCPAASRL